MNHSVVFIVFTWNAWQREAKNDNNNKSYWPNLFTKEKIESNDQGFSMKTRVRRSNPKVFIQRKEDGRRRRRGVLR